MSRRDSSLCWPCLIGGIGVLLLIISLFGGVVWPAVAGS